MSDIAIKRRSLILQGNLWKAILLLAIPAAINDFIRSAYQMVDTIFVSNIGSMEIAAITFVGPINMMVRTMSVGLSVAATNLIAREIGREDYKKARNVAMQVLIVAILIGLFIAVFSVSFSGQILTAASATPGIFDIANVYFRVTALSSPFVFINSIYVSVKRAEGDTYKAMKVNMVGMLIKIIASYVLIIVMESGIAGLAISTIIGTLSVSVYALYDLFFKQSVLQLKVKELRFSKKFLFALLIIAVPVIIEKSSISFSFIVLNKYVISHGEKVLASYGITNRINSLFFASVTGFASGLSPIISQNLGVKNDVRARAATKMSFAMATGIAVAVITVLWPLRPVLAGFFAKGDQDIIYHTINAMTVYSVSIIPWAWFQVANGVFQGTGHTKYNMIISIMRIYLFRLPLVIYFSNYTEMAEYSIWYGMLLSNLMTGLFGLALYIYHKKDLRLAGE